MIWHSAVSSIKSDSFWNVIATKNDILKSWSSLDIYRVTVWQNAIYSIKSASFWDIILAKINDLTIAIPEDIKRQIRQKFGAKIGGNFQYKYKKYCDKIKLYK
jgi:hypothetical protein